MNIRKTLLSGVLASSLALAGAAGFAQDSTPALVDDTSVATPVAEITTLEGLELKDADGMTVANVDIWEELEEDGGVWFSINSADDLNLEEGMRGVHVHETGVCDADVDPAFDTAGAHFNPTGEAHGDINADPSHAGDLGNLEVDDEGNFEHEVLAEKLTLLSGESNSLADEDGSALIIHSGEDDLETDPDGNAGDRWACVVIFPPVEDVGTPAATPATDDVAVPADDTDDLDVSTPAA